MARPGRRIFTNSPAGSGFPFQDNTATIYTIANTGAMLILASGSFVASAFPVPPLHHWVPSHKAATRFGSSSPRFWVPQKNGAEKGDIFMSYFVLLIC